VFVRVSVVYLLSNATNIKFITHIGLPFKVQEN